MTSDQETTIDRQNVHLARSRLYSLMSSLFLNGVTEANLDRLRSIEGLDIELGLTADLEELAAIHFDLFQIQIAPYESLFVDVGGVVGGRIAESVLECSNRMGCILEPNEFSLDHIGNELKVLSNLCLAAQLATSRGSQSELGRAEKAQSEFLHIHLLRWIDPFVLAVRGQSAAIFPQLADLLLECIHEHAESLPRPDPASEIFMPPEAVSMPGFSSAREIAGWLAMPCRCGFWLDKRTLAGLGRQAGLPSGFGSRQDMIENLFEAAAHYSAVGQLVGGIQAIAAEYESACRDVVRRWPVSGLHAKKWTALLMQTGRSLNELVSIAKPV